MTEKKIEHKDRQQFSGIVYNALAYGVVCFCRVGAQKATDSRSTDHPVIVMKYLTFLIHFRTEKS